MSTPITIPEDMKYVAGAWMSLVFVLLGQSSTVSRYRKRAGIEYPQVYAELSQVQNSRDALLFNCAQRVHQNTLEQIPVLLMSSLISGLQFPIPTAAAVGLWSLSRISYANGYLTGEPKKRATLIYMVGSLGGLGIILSSTYTVAKWIFKF